MRNIPSTMGYDFCFSNNINKCTHATESFEIAKTLRVRCLHKSVVVVSERHDHFSETDTENTQNLVILSRF